MACHLRLQVSRIAARSARPDLGQLPGPVPSPRSRGRPEPGQQPQRLCLNMLLPAGHGSEQSRHGSCKQARRLSLTVQDLADSCMYYIVLCSAHRQPSRGVHWRLRLSTHTRVPRLPAVPVKTRARALGDAPGVCSTAAATEAEVTRRCRQCRMLMQRMASWVPGGGGLAPAGGPTGSRLRMAVRALSSTRALLAMPL